MELRDKKLLILAGSDVHCKVVRAAKELGCYTVVTDYLVDSPAKKIADESLMFSITDVDGIVAYCKEHHIDGVLNFCNDTAQMPYYRICSELGVPCFCTKEQVEIFSNKELFKKTCTSYGVDVIQQYTEQDIDSGLITYPVIVKPVDSRGSRGVGRCNTPEELTAALQLAKKESKSGNAIIERCMYGKQDFTMTYFMVDGVPYLLRTGDRMLGLPEYGRDRQCTCMVCPSKHLPMYLEHVDSKIKNMLIRLGVKNGPVFMQGFVDGDTVRVYDPGIRFPGGDFETIYRNLVGADVIKAMVQFAITGKIEIDTSLLEKGYLLNNSYSVLLDIDAAPGTIGRFDGLDAIAQLPEVAYIMQKACVGEVIPDSGDVKQRVCVIGLISKGSLSEIHTVLDRIMHTVRIEDTQGNDMVLQQLNPSYFS